MNSRAIIDSIAVYAMFFNIEYSTNYMYKKVSITSRRLGVAIDIEIKEGYATITEEYYDTNKTFVATVPLLNGATGLFTILKSILE